MSGMNAVIFGTGEYVTGWTGAEGSKSDKSLGVVALVHFDLRERGLIGDKIALCGTNGNKFDQIRNHFKEKIVFSNLPNLEFEQFPQAGEVTKYKIRFQPKEYNRTFQVNPKAYLDALDKFAKPGDVCSVFTPDDSHFEIISAGGVQMVAMGDMKKCNSVCIVTG